ncbi:hypothetical protein CR194_13165 [Salipaludibacillus keqinensis]|uniref:Uncharacterized protein n=1 Tax=Salipaludibacillus keqinensis TaxID=2045207 RepID=A0A323TT38_9BACI|nr:hypothetical protein CR194_13165 [Salipaludibacillus keqinensis]
MIDLLEVETGKLNMSFTDSIRPIEEVTGTFESANYIYICAGYGNTLLADHQLMESLIRLKNRPAMKVFLHPTTSVKTHRFMEIITQFPMAQFYFHASANSGIIVTDEAAYLNETILKDYNSECGKNHGVGMYSVDQHVIDYLTSCLKKLIDTKDYHAVSQSTIKSFFENTVSYGDSLRNQLIMLIYSFEAILCDFSDDLTLNENKDASQPCKKGLLNAFSRWQNALTSVIEEVNEVLCKSSKMNYKGNANRKIHTTMYEIRSLLYDFENISFSTEVKKSIELSSAVEDDELGYSHQLIEKYAGIYNHLIGTEEVEGDESDGYINNIASTLAQMKKEADVSESASLVRYKQMEEMYDRLTLLNYHINKFAFHLKYGT